MENSARWWNGLWKVRPASALARRETVSSQLAALRGAGDLAGKLAEEAGRERGAGEPTTLLLIGLDDARALREGEGRGAAEMVQLTIARALGAALPRRSELLARVEEGTFAAVLPATDLPGALRVVARLRWAVLRLDMPHPVRGTVTVSFGVAVECGALEDQGEALLGAAKRMLREAQVAGDGTRSCMLHEPADERVLPPMRSIRAGVAASAMAEAARPW